MERVRSFDGDALMKDIGGTDMEKVRRMRSEDFEKGEIQGMKTALAGLKQGAWEISESIGDDKIKIITMLVDFDEENIKDPLEWRDVVRRIDDINMYMDRIEAKEERLEELEKQIEYIEDEIETLEEELAEWIG